MHIWNFIPMLALVMTTTSADIWKTVERYQGWYAPFWNDNTLEGPFESIVQDRILCEWACFNSFCCTAVTYNSDDLSCRMYDEVFSLMYNETMVEEISTSIFERLNVTHVWDTTSLFDTWSVEAARGICKLLNLQLITFNELNKTQSYYNSSECGLVDGNERVRQNEFGVENCNLDHAKAFCG